MRISLLLFLALLSCAEKKYATRAEIPGGQGKAGQCLVDCTARFSQSGFCLSHNWETPVKDLELVSFTFKISRPNALDQSPVPVDFADPVSVTLFMPSMGHGSSPVTLEKLDSGTYRATRVFFSMTGDWEVRVQVKNGNDVKDQAVLNIRL